jgi:hypothetical protein
MKATHIRFALEVEKTLDIKDRDAYLSGVLYPDSRFMCGIDRNLTHNPNLKVTDALIGTDFEKGWKVHVLYDILQHDFILGLFSIKEKIIAYSDNWFMISACKYIEDIKSYKTLLEYPGLMASVSPTHAPNNEKFELLKNWYDMQRAVYSQEKPCFESY